MNILLALNIFPTGGWWNKYTEKFVCSLIPNSFYHGLKAYLHLRRLNEYGVNAYGGEAEMNTLDLERRREQFPWAFPTPKGDLP